MTNKPADFKVQNNCQKRYLSTKSFVLNHLRPNKTALCVMAAICTLGFFAVFVLFALISSYLCLGQSCSSNPDCPTYESCCGNTCKQDLYCLGFSCLSNSDCGIYGSCCSSGKCHKNCTSAHCSRGSDCRRQEDCCNNKCTLGNCTGIPCETDSDCGSDGSLKCCFTACSSREECQDDSLGIAASIAVITILFMMGFLFKVFLCFSVNRYYQRFPHHRETTPGYAEQRIPPPYPGHDPPPYKITCPDYPPPRYDRLQATCSSTESTRLTEAPPPYSAAPERSVELCPSNPIYGAVVL